MPAGSNQHADTYTRVCTYKNSAAADYSNVSYTYKCICMKRKLGAKVKWATKDCPASGYKAVTIKTRPVRRALPRLRTLVLLRTANTSICCLPFA